MDNFIFSINGTLPLFLVVYLGILIKRLRLVDQNFANQCDRLVFRFTLPFTLFSNMYGVDILTSFDGKFVGFCFAATLLSILGVWGIGLLFIRSSRQDIGEFIQGSYRGSIAILGFALMSNIYGSVSVMAPLMILGSVPLYNIAACMILSFYSPDNDRQSDPVSQLKKAILDVLKNPIILGIAAGCTASLIHLKLPAFMESTIRSISSLTTPLALLSIGIGFRGKDAIGKLPVSLTASLLKLFIIPAVFLFAAIRLGFAGEALVAIMIMLGSPSTASGYTMARAYGYPGTVSGSVVVLTTLGSAVSFTLWLMLLRTAGLI